ncbi:MAG: phage scaffolding protein [Staphylococcus haemolyticus]|uniref:phage scaffolding protein n=1 Tax=Staphylococcus haemolyticus TaxID=1283 RepID=UPI001F18D78E|nr:phage scaffolding protein [Staphylococcus haemolyticus]MCE4964407.1 phage scaffolding protein [Staphylococcus haemolyticus]UVD90679.1 phage scaffolding protein [Staphylococcus haemolyticus]WAI21004.1 MAG: phage scaffolding protein [Staphylococcus haemolyticus]WAI22171.1 MAG: phage scaffolding protein [Staphylococcus haemolyticus]
MELSALLDQFANGEVDKQKVLDTVEESQSGMVPRSRLNDKNAEIKDLKAEITNRDKQIADLEKSVKDESEIQKELDKVKQENADWQTKYEETQLNNAIKLAVAKEANDANDVLLMLDKSNLELQEDGNVKGLEDAVKALQESKPYLFADNKATGRTPNDGDPINTGITKEQFDEMTVAQREDLFYNHRETYDKLLNQ